MSPEQYEGGQIKLAIRHVFVESRQGALFTEAAPYEVKVDGVNGSATKTLQAWKHPDLHGTIVLRYV